MSACPVAASERAYNEHDERKDEWRRLMAEDKVRGWNAAECLANADNWWSLADNAWNIIEPRYIAKHDESAWESLEWSQTLDFIASEIVNHSGPDDELITSWLEFHTNRELDNE